MLERHGVVEGSIHPLDLQVVNPLPDRLSDEDFLAEKKRADQEKLLALVQYANHDGDRKRFIDEYFGIER